MFARTRTVGAALLVAIAAAMALSLGCVQPAWAGQTGNGAGAGVVITKTIQANDSYSTAGDQYTFTFTQVDGTGTTAASDSVAISNVTIAMDAMSSGSETQVKSAAIPSLGALSWPHAGVYSYEVAEQQNTVASSKDVTYSGAKYRMDVYVKNGASALEVADVVVTRVLDDSGAAVSVKVDSTLNTGEGFDFENTYKNTAALAITHNVAGDYADKTKSFAYTVKLTTPTYLADASYSYAVAGGAAQSATTSGHTVTLSALSLSDAQAINFTALPVGTKYEVTVASAADYTPSAATTSGVVGMDGATATVTNTYKVVSPTGIVMSNLPYILLIGIPVAALVAWLVVRRRKYARAA